MVSAASSSPTSIQLKAAVYRSDVGRARKTNEDGVLSLSKVPLFAVADGTGGPEPARVALTVLKDEAANLAARNAVVAAVPSSSSRLAVGRFLESLFSKANTAVFDVGEQIRDRRIAATLCAATIVGPHAFVAHVGDSRAYLLRQGELRCLTNDHTLAALQLRRGDITPEEFQTSPFRRTLAQAIGMSPVLEVDLLELRLLPGDLLIVTSNGLNRALSDDAIMACLMAEGSADARADLLIEKVHAAGAPDNTTFILIEIEGAERQRQRPQRPHDREGAARKTFLFSGLSNTEWHQIQPYLELVDAAPGDVLCRAGQAPIGFGAVADGRFKVELSGGEVRTVAPSEYFGALALASDGPALETVTALDAGALYVLTRPRFEEIVRLNPVLGGKLTLSLLESLGNRLGTLTTRLGHILDAANGKL